MASHLLRNKQEVLAILCRVIRFSSKYQGSEWDLRSMGVKGMKLPRRNVELAS